MLSEDISAVIDAMEKALERMAPDDALRHFHLTYLRNNEAVAEELEGGGFQDPQWLQRWDVAFADL